MTSTKLRFSISKEVMLESRLSEEKRGRRGGGGKDTINMTFRYNELVTTGFQ